MNLDQKLAAQSAAKAAQPALDAANAACAAFAPGDTSDAALAAFCEAVRCKREVYWKAAGYTFAANSGPVWFERGSRNARIVTEQGQRSVFCFVDLDNGNILKAAGWKAPAKGSRGNIVNGASQVGEHGAAYLR